MKLALRISAVAASSAIRSSQTINVEDKDQISITFGSCYGIWDRTSDIFKTIAPSTDIFIWLGDVAYIDS